MAAKEVYHKATVVDNESHEVSQMEDETQDTIIKQIAAPTPYIYLLATLALPRYPFLLMTLCHGQVWLLLITC